MPSIPHEEEEKKEEGEEEKKEKEEEEISLIQIVLFKSPRASSLCGDWEEFEAGSFLSGLVSRECGRGWG